MEKSEKKTVEAYKIGVGGCGKNLYKTLLKYVIELLSGLFTDDSASLKYEKEVRDERIKWNSIFKGVGVDANPPPANKFGLEDPEDVIKDYVGRFYEYGIGSDEIRKRMQKDIGYAIGDRAPGGYIRCPETEMTAFALDYARKEVFEKMFEEIKPHFKKSDYFLFFVGLGGGTGTGIINPASKYWQEKSPFFPTFVLGVLSGEKMEGKIDSQKVTYYRRHFNAMWALSDLLTGGQVHAVILVDNDRICEIEGIKEEIEKILDKDKKMKKINEYIIKSVFPMLDVNQNIEDMGVLRSNFMDRGFTPILVPCYWSGRMEIKKLIKEAINNGKLADCDISKADRIYVFVRGKCNKEDIIKCFNNEENKKEIGIDTGIDPDKVWVVPNIGGKYKEKEVLILLRNPGVKGALKDRIDNAIDFAGLVQNSDNTIKDKEVEETVREEAIEYLHENPPFKFLEKPSRKANIMFIKDFITELDSVRERIKKGEQQIFQENVRIKLGCSFSMDARYSEELDQQFQKMPGVGMAFKKVVETKTLKNLKEIFLKEEGLKLSEIVTVMKEKEDEWEITDEERKFIVRKEDGKLNVYNSVGSSIFSREEDGLSKERLLDLLKGDEDVKREIKTILNPITDLP